MARPHRARRGEVLHPARQQVADRRLGRAVRHDARRRAAAERVTPGAVAVLAGLRAVLYMFFGWFGTVIGESESGIYNEGVDHSFRMGMMWFIFSEVMFFARVLRRAVLRAPALGAVARRRRHEVPDQAVPLATIRRRVADQRARQRRRRRSRPSRRSACRRSTPRSC